MSFVRENPPNAKTPASALGRSGGLSLFVCLAIGLALGLGYAVTGIHPDDAGMFWQTGHSAAYYSTGWAGTVYVYPPPLAQLLGVIPWPLFIVPWMLLVFGSWWYALRWLALPMLAAGAVSLVVGFAPLADPLALTLIGNPQAVLAAAIVVGFRHPAAWAVVVLSKLGPGIGLLWFAARGEWRSLGIALGTVAAIVGLSFVLAPATWGEFVAFAVANFGTPPPVPVLAVPLVLRLPVAAGAIVWAARTDRPWVLPLAAAFGSLALYQWSWVIFAATAVSLWSRDRHRVLRAVAVPVPGPTGRPHESGRVVV